jgi:hypothetical protein
VEELEEDDDDPVDELDELELDEDEELELEDDEDEDEDADDDEDVDEDELEPELEELPVLDDELPMGVGVPGVSSPQPTRRVPAAIDAAPESSSRKCRRSVTSGFVSGAGIFSVTV